MESGTRSAWRLIPAWLAPVGAGAAVLFIPAHWIIHALAMGLAVGVCALWVTRRLAREHREDLAKIALRLGTADPRLEPLLAQLDAWQQAAKAGLAQAGQQAGALRSVLDSADAPILATDADGTVTLCNAAGTGLLASRADRLLARPIQEVFTQADVLRLHDLAVGGEAGQAEVRMPGPEGVRTVEVSAAPLPGGGAVIAFRDVTELSRAVQVKTDFVANASHELRTPITALRMAVETLSAGADQDPAMRGRLLETIAGNTARLEEMVRDLLDLSRLESPEAPLRVESVPLEDVRAALSPVFEEACRERGLTLVFEFDPALLGVWTDRGLLLLILRNLIENATKFAYEGSPVRLTIRPTAEGVRAEVIDRGAGIPLQHQQRVFERYYQVDAARTLSARRRGTGLGLAIVKHAVRKLGGSVRLASVWKEGTTVTVDLPVRAAGAEPGPPPGPPVSP